MDITFQHLRHPTCMQVLTSDVTRVFLARSRTRSLCSPLSLSSPLSCPLSLSLFHNHFCSASLYIVS